jgi:hypothetical protein
MPFWGIPDHADRMLHPYTILHPTLRTLTVTIGI